MTKKKEKRKKNDCHRPRDNNNYVSMNRKAEIFLLSNQILNCDLKIA